MNTKLLVDTIVRQTMVLIAQLATSQGVRTPLAHVAGQVFMPIVDDAEGHGLPGPLPDPHAGLWSIAADGSGAPVEHVHVPRTVLLANLFADQGDLYFMLACFEVSGDTTYPRQHILRFRP